MNIEIRSASHQDQQIASQISGAGRTNIRYDAAPKIEFQFAITIPPDTSPRSVCETSYPNSAISSSTRFNSSTTIDPS